MSATSSTSTSKPGRTLSIIGIVCGVVSLLIIPIVFGIAGAALGFVGYAKGDKPLGLIVGIGSIVAMIIGMVLGAMVFSANN